MSLQSIQADLKTYINDNFSDVATRVFSVATEGNLAELFGSYNAKPMVGIAYAGGKPDKTQKYKTAFEDHAFDIWIILTIWKEEEVIEGVGTQKGILELFETLKNLFIDRTQDAIDITFTATILSEEMTDYYQTEAWYIEKMKGMAATIGLKVNYKEQL